MATVEDVQQFKKYNRQRRVQYSEESFASGIKYVTSPLELGYARNLVNFDLGASGDSLKPRQGLRAYEVSQEYDLTKATKIANRDLSKQKQIYYAADVIEEDGKTYRQAILGSINKTEDKDSAVKTGAIDLLTIYPDGTHPVTGYTNNPELKVLAQHTEVYDPEKYEYFFNSPNKAAIHGLELEDPSLIASHIGTEMATEGAKKYYCFRRNKETGKAEFVFSTFNKDKQCYDFEVLEPQATTAYNASLSMYNMLQEDPYVFNDKYNASTLQFLGVYTTDLEGNQRQATYKNTEYYFRMNYAAAEGQKYKVVWEWKEPISSNWTEIETQEYEFKEGEEPPVMQIKWSAPVSSVILRVQAFPYDSTREVVDILAFSTKAPKATAVGEKYYNPDDLRIYTATKTGTDGWTESALPLTSVVYKRKDDEDQLYRWIGNAMEITDEYDYISTQAMLINITLGETMSEAAQNLDYTRYDLSTCKGITTWGKRICIYAPDKASNMLFLSEPNNPAWFPFPRNVSLFNENIIKCIPYLDYLLVFTTDAIYQLTLGEDGDTWTERCLQKNLNIQAADVPLIKLIKNMVFFKSNNYFYMVVPSTSSTTGLSIAPISTNIEMYLDNFPEAVEEMLIEVYDYKRNYKLVAYKNHITYKNIYNTYTFETDLGCLFNLILIYNIETRYWTSYVIESQNLLESFKIDVADANVYMSYVPVVIGNKVSDSIQFLKYDSKCEDFYIAPGLTLNEDVVQYNTEHLHFKNYQYIDTGYREHNSDFKKRYREMQFKLNNYAQLDLKFYTQFMIDGYVRQDESSYEINKIVDPNDPRFGVITYDRAFGEDSGHDVIGSTLLGSTPLLPDSEGRLYMHNPLENTVDKLLWKLDISEFPETVFWKTRFPVSGKGYVPRLKILNMDQENYEILNISWVYRSLYSR